MVRVREAVGAEAFDKGRYKDAIALFKKLSTAKTFDTFLTLSAYRKIV